MRRLIHCILFAFLLYPAVTSAQPRVPATGSNALGGDVGIFLARAEGLGSGPAIEGFYEYGGSVFGGAEFFTGRTTAVKAEARYHVIRHVNGFNPEGLSLTVGLKQYF